MKPPESFQQIAALYSGTIDSADSWAQSEQSAIRFVYAKPLAAVCKERKGESRCLLDCCWTSSWPPLCFKASTTGDYLHSTAGHRHCTVDHWTVHCRQTTHSLSLWHWLSFSRLQSYRQSVSDWPAEERVLTSRDWHTDWDREKLTQTHHHNSCRQLSIGSYVFHVHWSFTQLSSPSSHPFFGCPRAAAGSRNRHTSSSKVEAHLRAFSAFRPIPTTTTAPHHHHHHHQYR